MIQREGSRRVINDQELVESLAAAGFPVKWITFDHGCALAETAYLLRDVHDLASPHALGTSVFMPTTNPVPTLISLDASRYSESWFINTVSAIGQRFLQSVCGPHEYVDAAVKARCPYYKDLAGAHKAVGIWASGDYVNRTPSAQRLAKQELGTLIGPEYDEKITMYFLEVFWRDTPRYVDMPRIVTLVQELQKDQEREQAAAAKGRRKPELKYQQYLDYLQQSRACGVKYCKQILKRNVLSESRAFGIHSIDNPSRWGQPAVDETVFQGVEDVPNWIPDSFVA
ncbi:hypothetical protein BGW39_006094 [Mortierella sp. 14UC]|nr:hypothetical protein BGW39_006094 [Mortierella sp. 14UC]